MLKLMHCNVFKDASSSSSTHPALKDSVRAVRSRCSKAARGLQSDAAFTGLLTWLGGLCQRSLCGLGGINLSGQLPLQLGYLLLQIWHLHDSASEGAVWSCCGAMSSGVCSSFQQQISAESRLSQGPEL